MADLNPWKHRKHYVCIFYLMTRIKKIYVISGANQSSANKMKLDRELNSIHGVTFVPLGDSS